jgi:hypothetical protein
MHGIRPQERGLAATRIAQGGLPADCAGWSTVLWFILKGRSLLPFSSSSRSWLGSRLDSLPRLPQSRSHQARFELASRDEVRPRLERKVAEYFRQTPHKPSCTRDVMQSSINQVKPSYHRLPSLPELRSADSDDSQQHSDSMSKVSVALRAVIEGSRIVVEPSLLNADREVFGE